MFTDKIAIVTGGASGIGQAVVETMAARNCTICIGDIAADKGEATAAAVRAGGGKAEYLPLDLCDHGSVKDFAAKALARFGRIDILVNGAGWSQNIPFVQTEDAFWDKVLTLNLVGPMRLTKLLLPQMFERKSGKIVCVSSDAGRVGSLGETVYSAAKAGLIGFSKSLAREGARYNVTSNVVCPGPTDTPLLRAVEQKYLDAFVKAIPLRRFGQPSEVADAVAFFASSKSDYVTGQVLSVSGGLTMVG